METTERLSDARVYCVQVPPSGGSLEIGNMTKLRIQRGEYYEVPPSGGSLEIGNAADGLPLIIPHQLAFPLRGDP